VYSKENVMLPGFTGYPAPAISPAQTAFPAVPDSRQQGVLLAGTAPPGCHLETSCYGVVQFCHWICDGKVAQSWQCGWCVGVWGW
jgi:hypothetical protein